MTTPTINWPGHSGTQYLHAIHPIGTKFVNRPGNYVFSKEVQPGRWAPIYIGQSEDLGRRLGSHDREEEAKMLGATHVHVHINENGERARLAEEKDLVIKWKPTCNTQLVY